MNLFKPGIERENLELISPDSTNYRPLSNYVVDPATYSFSQLSVTDTDNSQCSRYQYLVKNIVGDLFYGHDNGECSEFLSQE